MSEFSQTWQRNTPDGLVPDDIEKYVTRHLPSDMSEEEWRCCWEQGITHYDGTGNSPNHVEENEAPDNKQNPSYNWPSRKSGSAS
jgi:hypothetical protein